MYGTIRRWSRQDQAPIFCRLYQRGKIVLCQIHPLCSCLSSLPTMLAIFDGTQTNDCSASSPSTARNNIPAPPTSGRGHKQPLEAVVEQTIRGNLPPSFDDLHPEWREVVTDLPSLSNEALWAIARSRYRLHNGAVTNAFCTEGKKAH